MTRRARPPRPSTSCAARCGPSMARRFRCGRTPSASMGTSRVPRPAHAPSASRWRRRASRSGLPADHGEPFVPPDDGGPRLLPAPPGARARLPGVPVRSRILPFGEAAVLVQLEAEGTLAAARQAQVLADAVRTLRRDVGDVIGAPVPGASSVLVSFDPMAADVALIASLLEPLLAAEGASSTVLPTHEGARLHELQVRYGGEDGPDLPEVAAETGLGERGVVELHASVSYEVLFLGFAPGFAYLGELPPALVLSRLPTPRVRVPPGSVAIAGAMTAVYPGASAGGWRLLGRTDAALFDPTAEPPARLRPGDRIRFVPA